MPTIHAYDARTREYLKTVDWTPPNEWVALPADATTLQPPAQREGFARVLNLAGDVWEHIEDHRDKAGFVEGQPHTVRDLGPLPAGWSDTAPEPTPEQQTAQRRAYIQGELAAIDMQSVRPLRAKLAGAATAEDEARLASLEARALELRAELASLV